ncbi:hypothetical protein E2C01_041146 [Portunus trituberculatus]|uniref:Uncharacterized protein n=1 Tax=Portunus trituberculatus TaxID=210409 RepID=A0A5B7FJ86_PORTR|nr:hypothetical protein [Portunus trituberculatus]
MGPLTHDNKETKENKEEVKKQGEKKRKAKESHDNRRRGGLAALRRPSAAPKQETLRKPRHQRFGEEKIMMFIKGDVVLYKLKIRYHATNVAEVNEEKVEEDAKTFKS